MEKLAKYREIGIRSHGRGIFHKPLKTGTDLGAKRIFAIEPGDIVLNIVFAWEGAVALAGSAERGMCGSHRFPTYRPIGEECDARYIVEYLRSDLGLRILGDASPGSAGRNRTLNQSALLDAEILLPTVVEQRRTIDLLAAIDSATDALTLVVDRVTSAQAACRHELIDAGGWPKQSLAEVIRIDARLVDPTQAVYAGLPHVGVDRIESATGRLLALRSAAEDGVTSGKYLFGPEEVVYAKIRPNLRKVAWPRVTGLASADAYPLCSTDGIDPAFLQHLLLTDCFSNEAASRSGRTKMPKINRKELLSIRVPVPPVAEQRRIASVLNAMAEVYAAAHEERECVQRLRAACIHDVLTGRHEIPSSYDVALESAS
ncbi:MAG: type restriction enzyme subunit [Acidimicrobiaceae bacterium]